MSITKNLSGSVWKFNDTIDVSESFSYDIIFTYYNSSQTQIELIASSNTLRYDFGGNYNQVYSNNSWVNQNYRTITISNGTDKSNEDLINWLKNNAIYLGGGTALSTSKIIINGVIEMDVTKDTIASDKTMSGYQGTKNSGEKFIGSIATVSHPNPTASITNSTGLVTASHTQTAGLVDADTSTGTLQLTTKSAETYTPTTTDQTIAANKWLTGAQTIKGDANLVSANIADGVSIFGVPGSHVGGASVSYYTGGVYPPSNVLGEDGDIFVLVI